MTLGRATASAAPFNIVFCQRRLADRASCRCANLGLAVQAENVPLRETKVEEGSRRYRRRQQRVRRYRRLAATAWLQSMGKVKTQSSPHEVTRQSAPSRGMSAKMSRQVRAQQLVEKNRVNQKVKEHGWVGFEGAEQAESLPVEQAAERHLGVAHRKFGHCTA
jgi:hypothetical protein